jgi:large subunit ribosomal protein L17
MAVLRNLVTSLIEHGKIETTQANAVEAQKLAEKFITLAIKNEADYTVGKKKVSRAKLDAKGNKMTTKKTSKNGREYTSVVRETVEVEVKVDSPARLHARRQILGFLYNVKDENGLSKMVVNKLFDEIAPKYKERKGGYTRILKMGQRRGDGAEVAILELI